MAEDIIIDGYNLIKSPQIDFPALASLEAQREHLLRVLHSSPGMRGKKITVVFDGYQPVGPAPRAAYRGIKVIFSGKSREADEIIQNIIRRKSGREKLRVVSSDHAIRNTAKDHGAEAVDSPAFWRELQRRPERSAPRENSPAKDAELSDREVEMWKKLFRERDRNRNKE